MNKYAQILNDKVHWIFQDEMTLQELYLNKFNSEQIKLINITDNLLPIVEGWSYVDGGFVNPNPPKTLDELKIEKIEQFKKLRDAKEVDLIVYKDKMLDFDDKARERMRIAKEALVDNNLSSQLWTCADNSQMELSVQDFKNINTQAALRSSQLHVKYNELKVQVQEVATKEELEQITWE